MELISTITQFIRPFSSNNGTYSIVLILYIDSHIRERMLQKDKNFMCTCVHRFLISDNRVVPPEFVLRTVFGLQTLQFWYLSIVAVDRLKRLVTDRIVEVCCESTTRLTILEPPQSQLR